MGSTHYMRKRFEEAGYDLGTGDGPIITPHFGNKDVLYAIVQNMYKRGVQTLAVTYPIVEPGRGRLRFICSAAHTHEDIDKTLEALIEAEKEAHAQLASQNETENDTKISFEEVEEWTREFASYIEKWMESTHISMPDLMISIRVAEQSEQAVVIIKNKTVTYAHKVTNDLPVCELTLNDIEAFHALQLYDTQQFLEHIFKGTCELNGQVEAFIWFYARFVTQKVNHETIHVLVKNLTF